MNKITDGNKCTILWHVDDLKTSHINPDVIYRVLSEIDAEYGMICKNYHHAGKSA